MTGGLRDVGDQTTEVLVAVFGDASRAADARAHLAELEAGGTIAMLEALVISRDQEGGVAWDLEGPGAGHIGGRADTVATMLGVLLSAETVVAGLSAGSVPGRDGEDAQRAFGERFARELARAVPPGGSLVVAVVEDRWGPEVQRGLRGYHRLAGES